MEFKELKIIIKRLYKEYVKRHIKRILIALFLSIIVAGSTSAIAWLLDPAVKKIFIEQNRPDLAEPEEAQAAVIETFLPPQLSDEELNKVILEVISSSGAEGMKDMGKVMGMASKQLAGKADGKRISDLVKKNLST